MRLCAVSVDLDEIPNYYAIHGLTPEGRGATAVYDVAVPRFRKEADNIRAALSRRLGREMKFKPVAHDFGSDPAPSSSAPLDEEPSDDDEIDLADLVDGDGGAPAVDSVTLITQSLGATVVEEVPRD